MNTNICRSFFINPNTKRNSTIVPYVKVTNHFEFIRAIDMYHKPFCLHPSLSSSLSLVHNFGSRCSFANGALWWDPSHLLSWLAPCRDDPMFFTRSARNGQLDQQHVALSHCNRNRQGTDLVGRKYAVLLSEWGVSMMTPRRAKKNQEGFNSEMRKDNKRDGRV